MKNSLAHKLIVVTGANSLLGTNLIMELLHAGYAVRGLLRKRGSYTGPTHPLLELLEGNFTQPLHRSKALKGCHTLIHTAAITDQSLLHYDDYKQVNVDAVEELAEECIRMQVNTMIFVGSANAFGHGSRKNPGHELLPPQEPFTRSFYAQSKINAQNIILQIARRQTSTRFMVVNPGFMLGPFGSKTGSGKILLMYLKQKIILCPPGGKSFISVKDVAKGIYRAMEKGKNGQAWLLTHKNLSYHEFFTLLNKVRETHKPIITIPPTLLILAGYFGELLRKAGIKTSLSLTNARILCQSNFYSHHKASSELNVIFTPLEDSLEESLQWFEKNHLP